jgi:2-hydroxychromene-2-carboxylate isomerase
MAQTNRVLEFFFDVGSPYSYLAATQVGRVGERAGAPVRWRPFLLGGVFKATGNDMPARLAAKARWMLSDLARWAELYGVPFQMSSRFPLNTLRTQRALVAAGRLYGETAIPAYALALFQAYWADDRDVSADAELRALAVAAGLDGDAILQAIDEPGTKDALRLATEEAVQRGAFGAPTFFVGEAMFWGNDRLVLVEADLRGLQAGRLLLGLG